MILYSIKCWWGITLANLVIVHQFTIVFISKYCQCFKALENAYSKFSLLNTRVKLFCESFTPLTFCAKRYIIPVMSVGNEWIHWGYPPCGARRHMDLMCTSRISVQVISIYVLMCTQSIIDYE